MCRWQPAEMPAAGARGRAPVGEEATERQLRVGRPHLFRQRRPVQVLGPLPGGAAREQRAPQGRTAAAPSQQAGQQDNARWRPARDRGAQAERPGKTRGC